VKVVRNPSEFRHAIVLEEIKFQLDWRIASDSAFKDPASNTSGALSTLSRSTCNVQIARILAIRIMDQDCVINANAHDS
jgi:hypothetical protein